MAIVLIFKLTGVATHLYWPKVGTQSISPSTKVKRQRMGVGRSHTGDGGIHVCTGILSFLSHIQLIFDEQQLYVSLSSMKEWDSIHNHFDLTVFYDHIVRIMRDNCDDEWYHKIIQNLTK